MSSFQDTVDDNKQCRKEQEQEEEDEDDDSEEEEKEEEEDDIYGDNLTRTRSTESMDNFDICESNILSSLFDGIPIKHVVSKTISENDTKANENEIGNNSKQLKKNKMKCVNVLRTKQTSNSILMKTGFREKDEIRIIFKKRPLGIQIKPLNIHGFGAKISKITNNNVFQQGIYNLLYPCTQNTKYL